MSRCGFSGGLFGGFLASGIRFEQREITVRLAESIRVALAITNPPGPNCQADRFRSVEWSWNRTEGPPGLELGVHPMEPQLGPIAVTIDDCQCQPGGDPVWTTLAGATNLVNGHWEQWAWLSAPQTMVFQVRGVREGRTNVRAAAFIPPCSNQSATDCANSALASLAVIVVQ